MTLPVPLSVRIVTARTDRHITAELHDLTFRSAVPGGFASARMAVNRRLTFQPDDVAYYARVIVYDKRNGRTVWEGRLEDPGRSTGSEGELWELSAVGPAAHAQDSNAPVVWCDRRLDGAWEVFEQRSATNANTQFATDSAGNPIMRISPNAASVLAGWRGNMIYQPIRATGQVIARVSIAWDAGWTNANWTVRIRSLDSGDVEQTVNNTTVSTSGGTLSGVYSTNIRAGDDKVTFDLTVNVNSAGIDDTTWIIGLVHCVRAALHDKTGSLITTGYTANTVLASEVVADLLGTRLTQYDGANASVASTLFGIDQLAYPDGVTAAEVFQDLMALEPSYYWAAWERNPATDKHRFEWRAWPTTVAYDADVVDGYSSTGSADGLYNRVQVRWRNEKGISKVTTVTQAVPELTAAGLTRDDFLDLSDEFGSSSNATRVAEQFLIDHSTAPNQGSLTVTRPIYDHTLGRVVAPWEIRPGKLVRVRGLLANSDTLNATDRDGVTVFKVIAVDFDAGSASARLELDSQPLTLAHLLAAIKNVRAVRWRERFR